MQCQCHMCIAGTTYCAKQVQHDAHNMCVHADHSRHASICHALPMQCHFVCRGRLTGEGGGERQRCRGP
jgi:hypothetical protein